MRVVEDSGGHGWHVLSYRTSCVRVSAQSRAKRCKDRVVRTEAAEARMQSGERRWEWGELSGVEACACGTGALCWCARNGHRCEVML